MLKQKKVIRFILAFIATICLSIGPFVSSPKAESFSGNTFVYYHYSNNIQGTASGYREETADYYIYNDPTNTKYRSIVTINFEGPVTGTFSLGLPVQYNSSDVVVTENCVVDSVTAGTTTIWYFNVNGVDSCTVEYYTNVTSRGLSSFSGTWTHSTDLDDVNNTLGQIKGYIDGVETSLNNIYSRLGAINTSISLTNTILGKIADYYQLRDSADIPIYSRFAYINLLRYGVLSDQYNYPYSTAQYGLFPTILTSNYSEPAYNSDFDIDIPAGKTLHFIYTVSYWANIFDFIDSNSNSVNPIVNMIEGNNYYRTYDVSYYNNTNSRLWVNVAMNRNVNRPVIPLYIGVNVPEEVASLFNIDFENTYTRLLQSINNGISALQSDQTTIDQSTNITNNFNTEINKINVIENNILTGFDNKINNVNSAINDSGVLDPQVTQTPKAWAEYYSGLVFDNLTVIKYPVYIILIGFVLLCLLG